MTEIAQDGDGDISFNEFVWLMTRLHTNGKKPSEEKKTNFTLKYIYLDVLALPLLIFNERQRAL